MYAVPSVMDPTWPTPVHRRRRVGGGGSGVSGHSRRVLALPWLRACTAGAVRSEGMQSVNDFRVLCDYNSITQIMKLCD